jgi:hypothetical protein
VRVFYSITLALLMVACNTPSKVEKNGSKRGHNDASHFNISFTLPSMAQSNSPTFLHDDEADPTHTHEPDSPTSGADWSLIDSVIYRLIANREECSAYQLYSIDVYRSNYTFKVDPKCDYKLSVKIGSESTDSNPNNVEFVAMYETEQAILVTGEQIKAAGTVEVPVKLKITNAGTTFGFEKEWLTSTDVLGQPGVNPTNPTDPILGLVYADIKPIIDAKCASCHAPQTGRSDLTTFSTLKAASIVSVQRAVAGTMPPSASAPLTEEEKQKLQKWADGGYLETKPTTPSTEPGTNTDPNVVEFRIAAGTGKGAWNTAANKVVVKVGQTLKIINSDTIQHQLHTDGAPCEHGSPIAPGATFECKISQPYSGGKLRDHDSYGDFFIEAVQ